MTKRTQSVLVFRTGQLGDTLIALPAIAAVRRRHPEADIVLLTDQPSDPGWVASTDVIRETELVDRVVVYRHSRSPQKRTLELLRVARALSGERFMAAYALTHWRTNAQRWRDKILLRLLTRTSKVALAPQNIGATPEWRRLVATVTQDDICDFTIKPSLKTQEAIDTLFERLAIPRNALLVALGPGSKMAAKRWPWDRYLEVGRRVLENFPEAFLLVLGGSEDGPVGEQLCGSWGERSRNLAGLTTIMESACVLGRSAAYVGNDTGTMHLAALSGAPCVAIFSSRDVPGKWAPYGPRHVVLRSDPPCSGCMLEICTERRNECLTAIDVEGVSVRVNDLLEQVVHGRACGGESRPGANASRDSSRP